eukprot:8852055-Pyramimonas_sp.AAC.1
MEPKNDARCHRARWTNRSSSRCGWRRAGRKAACGRISPAGRAPARRLGAWGRRRRWPGCITWSSPSPTPRSCNCTTVTVRLRLYHHGDCTTAPQ